MGANAYTILLTYIGRNGKVRSYVAQPMNGHFEEEGTYAVNISHDTALISILGTRRLGGGWVFDFAFGLRSPTSAHCGTRGGASNSRSGSTEAG